MSNYLIRYADVEHGENLFEDYLLSGLLDRDFNISAKGDADLIRSASKLKKLKISQIQCSEAKASVNSATYLADKLGIPFELNKALNSVKHDFSKLISEEDLLSANPVKMKNLRSNFVKQFLNDQLLESKYKIVERLELLKDLLDQQQDTLMISHGTTLKLFSLFALNDFKIDNKILTLESFDKPFYGSLKGYKYPELSEVKFC